MKSDVVSALNADVVSTLNADLVLTLKSDVVSTLCLDVETTKKMDFFPDVEIINVVSTLKSGCSTSRPKINVKTTLKQDCVPVWLDPFTFTVQFCFWWYDGGYFGTSRSC